ncbi:MAG: nucleotidyltransferase family protein, partial [Alphaproteobacteria bacterium]
MSGNASASPVSLLAVLRDPAGLDALDLAGWDAVLRQARHENLLGRVAVLAQGRGIVADLPAPVRGRLAAIRVVTDKQAAEVRWEARQIAAVLAGTGVDAVMLKGAAYLLAGLPAAEGRLFSDVDFLVPKERLSEVEGILLAGGWVSDKIDAYDQRYYRTWMHELPPLRHLRRQTH